MGFQYGQSLKNLEITDDDWENISGFSNFIKAYIEEIVDEVVGVLSKDREVVDTLIGANLPVKTAKQMWIDIFIFLFDHSKDDEFFERLHDVGVKHAAKNVRENLFMNAVYLFHNHIISKLRENGYIPTIDQILSLNKLFGLLAAAAMSSYVEERESRDKAVIRVMGIKDRLLERLVEIGRK